MSIGLVLAVILVGLVLILLEVLVIPGVGVAGILGAMLIIGGVVLAYTKSMAFGHAVLAFSAILSAISFYFSLKAKTWNKVSLNDSIATRVNELNGIEVGNTGIAVSRLVPIGKAEINGLEFEVESVEGYIEEQSKIKVVAIEANKIYVRKIN
jgi:membrane-bound ClpP family serine protease